MPPRLSSLAIRLAVSYAVTAFLLVAAAAFVQYRSLSGALADEDTQELTERLREILRSPSVELRADRQSAKDRMVVRLLDKSCRPTRIMSAHLPPPSCDLSAAGGEAIRDFRSPGGTHWKTIVASFQGGWVEVLLDRSTDDRVMNAYVDELMIVLAAALLISAALGYGIARHGLNPLLVFSQRVTRINAHTLGQRFSTTDKGSAYPTEVQGLARSLDAMLHRLEGAFQALTEFSGELAHELRTPIHVLRQNAEVALRRPRSGEEYRDVLGANLEELDRMRRMTDDILFLARAEDPRAVIQPLTLNVCQEVSAVVEFLAAHAVDQGIVLDSEVPLTLELSADRTLLRRALVNIVANALQHTPTGGRVIVKAERHEKAVRLEVEDTGSGIPPELLPHIFDRHTRGLSSNSAVRGTGLGLAIVRGIVSLHGGTVEAMSVPGKGTRVALLFPVNGVQASFRD